MIDVNRMVYVAGYNRRTAADLQDVTLLGADEGYFFSRKGDGTVPHNLGLLAGVKTFYVDEEHSKLPTNQKSAQRADRADRNRRPEDRRQPVEGHWPRIRGRSWSWRREPGHYVGS